MWRTAWILCLLISLSVPVLAENDPDLLQKLARTMATSHAKTDRFEAEVWLIASDQRLARFVKNPTERLEILNEVFQASTRQELDADLVLAVMQVESAFDRFAISAVGAQGIMQVMPFWRDEIGRPQDNLTDLNTNLRYGTTILAHYLTLAQGDLIDALARYNGSRGRLKYPDKVIKAWRTVWRNKTREDLSDLQAGCQNYGLDACRYQ